MTFTVSPSRTASAPSDAETVQSVLDETVKEVHMSGDETSMASVDVARVGAEDNL